jgi:hypothetical protein
MKEYQSQLRDVTMGADTTIEPKYNHTLFYVNW